VEAITLANIPTELNKQICELKLATNEHNVKQDEQLQIITTLRTHLEERLNDLQSVLDEVKGPDLAAREQHIEQLDASRIAHTRVDELSEVLESRADQLESAMKEQKQLMVTLTSFLEDKTSRSEAAVESGNERAKESGNQNSWPSSTLSTAYFAALLLSSVLSSVAATSIVTRKHRSLNGTSRPVFLQVDYSLPGLGPLNKIRVEPSLLPHVENTPMSRSALNTMMSTQVKPGWSTRDFVTSTSVKPIDSSPTRVAEWLQDYSRTERAIRQREERKSRIERREYVGYYPIGPGWSSGLSKLNEPKYGGEPTPGDPDGGGFYVGPGPVIPSYDPAIPSHGPVLPAVLPAVLPTYGPHLPSYYGDFDAGKSGREEPGGASSSGERDEGGGNNEYSGLHSGSS
jgi:hypothetical protein